MMEKCRTCQYFTCQHDSNYEIAITHCTHPDNPVPGHEGNTKQTLCPLREAIEPPPVPFPPVFNPSGNAAVHSHYFKDVRNFNHIDVYAVCQLFGVDDQSGALHHAIKKLLCAGIRGGGKNKLKDIREAVDSLNRYLELNKS